MRVSFIVFAYNQEKTVGDAVRAALAQDCEEIEIILSDDASPDGTFSIMQDAASTYDGPHKVRARRSKINRGIIGHVLEVVSEAQGDLLVFAAGDDISCPTRAREILNTWQGTGHLPALIYSDFEAIDMAGGTVNLQGRQVNPGPFSLHQLATGISGPMGATSAVTKDLFTRFPPIAHSVIHEDRVLPFRALLSGGRISYLDKKLVRYRVSGGISRSLPRTVKEYLREFSRSSNERTLGDARQRLTDAQFARPDDRRLHRACRSTIVDQEAKLQMSAGRNLEYLLLKHLLRGARVIPMLKHYAKFYIPERLMPNGGRLD